jgi:deazaflavin-dependent oxidoreductase (nitroreductase family)
MNLDFDHSPFPDGRWGVSDTSLARALQRFAASPVGSATLRRLVPLDRKVLLRSHGRYTVLGPFGSPMLLLTVIGRVSGLARTTPLVYLPDGDTLLVVGSNFGQAAHPAWALNLLAHRDATIAIRGEEFSVTAEELEGSDRDRAWNLFTTLAKPYEAYGERTTRHLKVFALRKAQGQ